MTLMVRPLPLAALRATSITIEWVAPVVLAASGILSLNPYPFWYTATHLMVAAIATAGCGGLLIVTGRGAFPKGAELVGATALTIFVIYITALPKVDGGHIKWVFVLPTLWTLAIMPVEVRWRTLTIFAGLFAASTIPACLLSLYLVTGFPISLTVMPYGNPAMADAGVLYLTLPGALVLESNSMVMPWGGMLARIAGIYDEPNSVGTVAALTIAALRCNLRDWKVWGCLIAGALSFSLAFIVLTTLAFLLTALLLSRPIYIIGTLSALLSGAVLFGTGQFSAAPGLQTRVQINRTQPLSDHVPAQFLPRPIDQEAPVGSTLYVSRGTQLRMSALDSRSNPSMAALVGKFSMSGLTTKLFGVGSDASIVQGSISSSAQRLYTDYGFIGAAMFCGAFGFLGLGLWQRAKYDYQSLAFLALFAFSIYQRPVVWMPYALLLLLCGGITAHEPVAGKVISLIANRTP